MRLLTINGSPAGENSITLQTMRYMEKLYPQVHYTTIHAAWRIRSLEIDFSEAEKLLKEADLIVFCYPVYTFLVPSQLHRFIELIKEKGIDLRDKYVTQLSTSKHFYDTTAHEYIRENCLDLGMRYIRGLSADMEDLLHEKGQKEAKGFFRHLLWSVKHAMFECPEKGRQEIHGTLHSAKIPEKEHPKAEGKRVVVVTDLEEGNTRLSTMIERFRAQLPYQSDLVNIRTFPFAGGCLGCFHCASDGKCIYKDHFDDYLREKIQTADATVYAFSVKDHSMGYRFKVYDDRQFCNGHRTVTMGKPVGYLVDGMLSRESNLKTMLEARAQVGGNLLTHIAGNEGDVDPEIDRLCAELSFALKQGYTQPANFYGEGGRRIFRDLIYQMQGMMREDHRFYKKHGFYDFPQKDPGKILAMYLVGALTSNPKLMQKSGVSMTEGMLMPYKRVIEKAGKS